MRFVDTHCHFADEAFSGDADAAIARSLEAGVCAMLQADIDSKERPAMMELVGRHPGVLYHMAGLYPGSVDAGWQDELSAVESFLESSPVAVGEIGLDYHFSTEFAAQQREAFRIQLEMAASRNLPVNIHLRDATEDFFSIISDCSHLGLRGNLHAFSGSYETFRRLSRFGEWMVGVGGVVTFKNASLARAVVDIPLENIVLETDAPYLTPVPHRGERNESTYIPFIAAKVAELKGVDVCEVAEVTNRNVERLFGIIC